MRLEKLPPAQAERYAGLECPDFPTTPWIEGTALARRRVAIVSSAGMVVRGEPPFRGRDADYRVIPSTTIGAPQATWATSTKPARSTLSAGARI